MLQVFPVLSYKTEHLNDEKDNKWVEIEINKWLDDICIKYVLKFQLHTFYFPKTKQ